MELGSSGYLGLIHDPCFCRETQEPERASVASGTRITSTGARKVPLVGASGPCQPEPNLAAGKKRLRAQETQVFAGTTQPSDSLPAFMSRLWLITFLDRPAHSFVSDAGRASRFSRVKVPCIPGVFDLAGPMDARDIAPTSVAFPPNKRRRQPNFPTFRGSIPRLHVPLSTLRVQPHDWPRMTRGSVWLARPSPYGSFFRSSTPVYPGALTHISAPPTDRPVKRVGPVRSRL